MHVFKWHNVYDKKLVFFVTHGSERQFIRSGYPNYGKCECPKIKYLPLKEIDGDGNVADIESDCLQYWDGEEYDAACVMGGNFGCIHWEEK